MTFYFVTSIRTEIDGKKQRIGLSEAENPDDMCVAHCTFWRTVDKILKVEEAVWSEDDQRWVLKSTGKFPKNWCD